MKFPFSTRLNPGDKNSTNRIVMIGENTVKTVIGNRHLFINVNVRDMPFTNMVDVAWEELNNNSERTYYDIGSRPEDFGYLPSSAEYLHLNYTMLLILMRRGSARNLWFKTIPQYYASYIREEILNTNYAQRLKIEVLKLLLTEINPLNDFKKVGDFFVSRNFPRGTAELYLWYWLSGEAKKSLVDLAKCKDPIILSFEALMEEADIITQDSNLSSLAEFSAGRKLRFISNSNRFDTGDLSADLLGRARQVYIQCRPFLDQLHALNYARANVGSYTIRMINHFTKENISRFVADDHGDLTNRLVAVDEYLSDGFTEDSMLSYLDTLRE